MWHFFSVVSFNYFACIGKNRWLDEQNLYADVQSHVAENLAGGGGGGGGGGGSRR